jgi:hypothetical protein
VQSPRNYNLGIGCNAGILLQDSRASHAIVVHAMIPQTGSRNQREQSDQAHHTSCNEQWGSKHKRIVFAFDPAV